MFIITLKLPKNKKSAFPLCAFGDLLLEQFVLLLQVLDLPVLGEQLLSVLLQQCSELVIDGLK